MGVTLPSFLQDVEPFEAALAVGVGFIGGLRMATSVGKTFKVSPAAGLAILSAMVIGFPLIMGRNTFSTTLLTGFFGVGAGLAGAAVGRLIYDALSAPAVSTTTP